MMRKPSAPMHMDLARKISRKKLNSSSLKSMRIGLDLRMVDGGSGIGRYISEISHAILEQDKGNEYVLFFRNAEQSMAYRKYNVKTVIEDIPHYSLAEQFKF